MFKPIVCRCSTVFKYVTRYHTIMDHYVFLARGLFGQVSMAAELFSREEKTILVYDAADLSWDDGLEAARAMFTRQSGSGDQLPLVRLCLSRSRSFSSQTAQSSVLLQSFAIDTIELAAWYGDWKGLKPTDKITGSGSRLPEVSVDELLQRLGVFNSDLPKGQKVEGHCAPVTSSWHQALVDDAVTFACRCWSRMTCPHCVAWCSPASGWSCWSTCWCNSLLAFSWKVFAMAMQTSCS